MFNMSGAMPSVADIAAVTGGRNDNMDGMGGFGAWWVVILILAMFGWGRGGFGYGDNGGGNGSCCAPASCADLQRGFDNQGVTNKLNGLENGLCSLGYDQLAQMNGINQNINQTGYTIRDAITQMGIAQMQDTNALSRQLGDCCCENRAAIAQVRYDMATDTCAITTAVDRLGDRIEGRLTQMEMARKDERIAELQSLVNSLNLAQSQANQNQFFSQKIDNLQNTLRPCPTPAYITCNPWASQAPYGSCGGNNYGGCCN